MVIRERTPASQFFNQIIQEIHSIQTSKKAEEALSSIAWPLALEVPQIVRGGLVG